ncbi:hypothetical protein F4818DRAFT_439391 [Hypoxylon cercidicola]|nr:hypothetical protein F4818DRAFT_439391 [Hypoxylon cercidicola]
MPRQRMPLFDPYEVLGVSPDADEAIIKKAYRQLCLRYHPDKAGEDSHETFVTIQESYELLFDSDLRALYDSARKKSKRTRPTKSSSSFNPDCTRGESTADFEDDGAWYGTYSGSDGEDGKDETPKSSAPRNWYTKGSNMLPYKKACIKFRSRAWATKTTDQSTRFLDNLDKTFQDLYKRVNKFAQRSEKLFWDPLRHIAQDIAENKSKMAATVENSQKIVKGQWKNKPEVLEALDALYKLTARVDVMKRKLPVLEETVRSMESATDDEERRRLKRLLRMQASQWKVAPRHRFS